MKARIAAFVGLWLTALAIIALAPGCYGRNCEGGAETFGVDPGQGEMVSDTDWESSPPVGPWIPFPRQRRLVFDIRALGGRTPFRQVVYLSAAAQPNVPGSGQAGNQTVGAGNIALFDNVGPNHIDVVNDTCSDFYMRLVVEVPPFPEPPPEAEPPTPVPDAGTTTP